MRRRLDHCADAGNIRARHGSADGSADAASYHGADRRAHRRCSLIDTLPLCLGAHRGFTRLAGAPIVGVQRSTRVPWDAYRG